MKKLIFGMVVVAVATFVAYNVSKTDDGVQMSDLQMENVEILAEGGIESTSSYPCPGAALEWQIHSLKDDWNDEVYSGYDCMCHRETWHKVIRRCD